MDAVTLDHLIAELRPRLLGRHLRRVRGPLPDCLSLEIAGERDVRLLIDVQRGSAGLFLLPRSARLWADALDPEALPGRNRTALLSLRKHVEGRRLQSLARVAGERWLLIEGAAFVLSLRLGAPAPALTLVVGGAVVASLGAGPVAWPPPAPAPEREWDRVDPEAVAAAAATGERAVAAVLSRCPGLGPILARELVRDPKGAGALWRGLARPRPLLLTAVPLEEARDADLAPPRLPLLVPTPLPGEGRARREASDWVTGAVTWREALQRGRAFEAARRAAGDAARRERQRLEQLETNLARDRAGLPDPVGLRRDADALLAAPATEPDAAGNVEVPDPWSESGATLRLAVDPQRGLRGTAERLYARARRAERAALLLDERLVGVRERLIHARDAERAAGAARDRDQLPAPAAPPRTGAKREAAGPRHYLSSGGLSILVGRGGRENHELTFGRAAPEDYWLHARDVPGAHVILRDTQRRAGAADLREAAELAAFFSEAGREGSVDVHVARRKHLKPGRGGPGKVQIFHAETLRVQPRDPEGRLRRR